MTNNFVSHHSHFYWCFCLSVGFCSIQTTRPIVFNFVSDKYSHLVAVRDIGRSFIFQSNDLFGGLLSNFCAQRSFRLYDVTK